MMSGARVSKALFMLVLSLAVALASNWALTPAATAASTSASVPLSVPNLAPPAELGQPCTRDAARDILDAAFLVTSTQCVAGIGLRTRSRLRPECIIDARATQPG